METLDRPLRYFLRIAELRSLSKAADALDQTQSGLSKQLAVLEAQIGHALFIRTGRGMDLTEAGTKLYATLSPAFQDIDRVVESIREQGSVNGSVRLAAVHTLSYYFTADVVAQFTSTRPQVNLSLMGRSSPEVMTLVEAGKADLGFVYDTAVDSNTVVSTPLFDDDMVLIARDGQSPIVSPDIFEANLRLVGFPAHYALRRMLHSAKIQATYVAEAETIDAMLKLVSSGIGACILPSRIPDSLLGDYGLCKFTLNAAALRRRVVAITPADRHSSRLTRDLLECAMQVAEKLRRN
ncbi:LysR family transcriptional regulator [Variovorax boronicumulans]